VNGYANYNGNAYGKGRKGVDRGRTTPVGSFPPNAWGLFDVHGNVSEACQDWYGEYRGGEVTNPKGSNTGFMRILRGGSWPVNPDVCRSADRRSNLSDSGLPFTGCRVCLNSPGTP
jgi:formylglycine-generating enzyme required for sulfatase activity